jgi:predicted nucleotidyltransferase
MDVSDPTKAVTPTLDGPVLAVLAAAGRPMTVADVAAQAVRGSEIGIRRCLARLVSQGLVRATTIGRSQVHELNREHVAAPVAELLAGLRLDLWSRMRSRIEEWPVQPLVATVFGSAARGDGDEDSDIDLLLVHPMATTQWHEQLDELRAVVPRWTGNSLQVVDLSADDYVSPSPTVRRLIDEVRQDGVELIISSPLKPERPRAGARRA